MIEMIERLNRLSWIDRCSNVPHIKSYSVVQHSFYMALYAMIFSHLENLESKSEEIDVSLVIKKALLHDIEESLTGDILYPLHHFNPLFKEKLEEIREECVRKEVFKELPSEISSLYFRLWREAKDSSIEGQLIACMDKFEILLFAINELEMGNEAFRGIYDNAREIIKKGFNFKSVLSVLRQIEDKYGE